MITPVRLVNGVLVLYSGNVLAPERRFRGRGRAGSKILDQLHVFFREVLDLFFSIWKLSSRT